MLDLNSPGAASQSNLPVEQALHQDAILFRLVFEQASVGMALVDLSCRPVRANSALLRMLGYEKELFSTKTLLELTHPEEHAADANLFEQLTAGVRDQYQVEKRVLREDGKWLWCRFSGSLVRDAKNRPLHVVYLVEDISERLRSQRVISKLAAFAEFNPNPVFEFTPDGDLRYSNKAAAELAELVGKSDPTGILPPETREIVSVCWATGKSRLRLITQLKNRTISWSFFPISAIGRVHCYAGDVTEKLALEMRLLQSQKLEAIGRLAAGIAHDFNNILTVIEGNASLFLATCAAPPEQIQEVVNAARRGASLTRQLLVFSRRQPLMPAFLDINEVVSNLTRMLKRLLGEQVVLQSEFTPNLPKIHADPGMIEQVLMNLSVNGRDAMPQGGQLSIKTSSVVFDKTRLPHAIGVRAGHFVSISVCDSGIGIPADHLPRIFEPFFTTKEMGKGTGLGLATVFGIVQQHHGWIVVDSEVGKGTSFHIYLPASEELEFAPEKVAPVQPPPRGSETILVVEDEAPLRLLVSSLLRRYGYTVLAADSGVAALELWESHREKIDLVFTDLIMPGGVTGRELAQRLSQEKPGLKVLYTSGYSPEVAQWGGSDTRSGMMFLQKPYHPQKLAQMVRNCLDGSPN